MLVRLWITAECKNSRFFCSHKQNGGVPPPLEALGPGQQGHNAEVL